MIDIAVLDQIARGREMAALAKSLRLDLVTDAQMSRLLICYDDQDRLTLSARAVSGNPVFVELQTLYNAKGKDPLMKAIGYNTRSVFDATAGWAIDAMHIASHQIQVTACERNPVVFALITDGLKRCSSPELRANLKFIGADSASALSDMHLHPEVVYLDPMYPAKSGSAAPKKPLQLLQALYQLDRYRNNISATNENDLLNLARKTARRRVVVKRPHHAPPIAPNPSGAVAGKLVRFDLYPPL